MPLMLLKLYTFRVLCQIKFIPRLIYAVSKYYVHLTASIPGQPG